jgi:membrane protease YdiL (CAAX protease family)
VLLVMAQAAILGIVILALRRGHLTWQAAGWKLSAGQTVWREGAIGALAGLVLGLLYVFALSPLQTLLQRTVGDYVPAGETLATVGSAVLPFFVANVLLAPFVEESLYRGYAYTALRQRYGLPATFIILGAFFGLLHWAGGVWYMLLAGLIAGGLLTGLRAWRGSLSEPGQPPSTSPAPPC